MLQKAHKEAGQVNYYNDNDPKAAAEFI